WILTFNFVNIAWIFFRAENLDTAISLLKSMFGIVWVEFDARARLIPHFLSNIQGRNETLIYLILAFIVCLCFKNSIDLTRGFKPTKTYIMATMLLFWIPAIMLILNPYSEFIYFNF
ncbi:MBOAT family protein, partial [Helicobacter didelphidarum]